MRTIITQRNNVFLLAVTVIFILLQLSPFEARRALSPILLILLVVLVFLETVWGKEGSLKEDLLHLLPAPPDKV